MKPIITSILDNDLYKFTMQQAVLFGRFADVSYQDVDVEYEFINRGTQVFPPGFGTIELQDQIKCMRELFLTDTELTWLRDYIPFLKRSYLDFLRGYRYDPSQIRIKQTSDSFSLNIKGPWYSTVLWEVPLLAMISELYFNMQGHKPSDVEYKTQRKASAISTSGITVSDFGTRRRRSFDVQDLVVRILTRSSHFVGTSNVYFAKKYGIKPIGTHAHEFFMAHAALFGYRLCNRYALHAWSNEYGGNLGIALTDTFTTKVFFEQFDMKMSKLFDGVRQDSGDPIEFAKQAIAHYLRMNIDPMSKTIVFSDGLTVDKSIEIAEWCKGKIKCAFGIGTFLTNDCGCTPLNIVIKMSKCNDIPVVKLSDVEGKYTGTPQSISVCKQIFNL